MQTAEIRQRFINFYKVNDYRLLPRASMLDDSIPMSFVMSAGLVQVERSLTNTKTSSGEKFILIQDCFRHFDLDKVGKDDFHLSIFEMPGAFKFGPNGKVETIERMWHLATTVFGIDKNRLWSSYFKGGHVFGNDLQADDLVRETWLDLGLSPTRIIGLGAKDNYWLQGKGFNKGEIIQKSGPNTELFYDRGIENACSNNCLPGCKCGRFVEFSNSLFICYQVNPASGKFERLADPFSETVIGTERVAMILQGTRSVFEIDSYRPVLATIREFIQVKNLEERCISESERVIADHLKALYLLVADDAPPPGKNGRERIIKILIRGVLTRLVLLGITAHEFLPVMLSCLAEAMEGIRSENWVQVRLLEYFSRQQKQFKKTVERGYCALEKNLADNNGTTLSGQQVVLLEKNFGLPYLLVEKELRNKRLNFNRMAYEDALNNWKKQIRIR
jgi:alanyl-tRNA synthetase